jgi:ribosomal protein L37E
LIVCKRCGFKNDDDDADFCASCGRFLEWTGEKVEAPAPAAPAEAPPPEADDEAGRRGLIESAVNWVRDKGSDQKPTDGDAPATEDGPKEPAGDGAAAPAAAPVVSAPAPPPAPPAAVTAPAAAAAPVLTAPAPPPAPSAPVATTTPPPSAPAGPVLGPSLPAELATEPAAAKGPDGPAAPVFGPAIPATDGDAAPASAPAAAAASAPAAEAAKPAAPGPAMPKPAMPGPAMPGPAMPGPAMPGPAMPGPAVPSARNEPAPSQTLDPSLSAFIVQPVSVVAAMEDDAPKAKAGPDLGGGEGQKPGLAARTPRARERQPGEVTEEVFRPGQYAKEVTGPPRVVRDGDIVCPRCGQGNYPWRNYCRRCGLVLDHTMAASERRGPWRLMWYGLSSQVHMRGRRPVRAGERPGHKYRDSPKAKRQRRFSVPRFNKKKAMRAVPILLMIVFVIGFFGPFKTSFRRTLTDWKTDIEGAVNIQYVQLFPVSVQSSGADPSHPVLLATDGDTLTYWATPPPPEPKKKCTTVTVPPPANAKKGTKPTTKQDCTLIPLTKAQKSQAALDGVKSWIELNFSQPESVQGLSLISGAQTTPQTFQQYAKPKEVEMQFQSGPPLFFTFTNAPAFQQKKFITIGNTSFVKITIVSVYPGSGTALQKAECAITEIDAYSRS